MTSTDNTILEKVERELISSYAFLDSWLDLEREAFDESQQPHDMRLYEILDQTLQSNDSLLFLVQRGRGFVTAATGGVAVDVGDEEWFSEVKRPCGKALQEQHRWMSRVDRLRRAFRRQLGDGLFQVDMLKRASASGESDNPIVNLMELDVFQYLHFISLQTRGVVMKLSSARLSAT